jgi:hypothetical protein
VIATRALTHPASLIAIALLVINDHVLKQLAPGIVTGKLSDVAGLIFFPLLLAACAEHAGIRRGMSTIAIAAATTAVGFIAIKLWLPAADVYRAGLAMLQWPFRAAHALFTGHAVPVLGRVSLAMDPTDLVALVALVIPISLARNLGGLGLIDHAVVEANRGERASPHAAGVECDVVRS